MPGICGSARGSCPPGRAGAPPDRSSAAPAPPAAAGVAYPLVRSPRLYTSYDDARRLTGAGEDADELLLWLNDRSQLDVTLAQACAASYGVSGLRFVTRHGYEQLIGRAAGIVIALVV